MSLQLEDVRTFIASRVREGFDSRETIVVSTLKHAADELDRDDLERITSELLATPPRELPRRRERRLNSGSTRATACQGGKGGRLAKGGRAGRTGPRQRGEGN